MSVARHTVYNLAGAIVPLAVTIVTVPLYLHLIGPQRYGILALCWTLLGFMGFMNLGIGPAVAQKLAASRDGPAKRREDIFWSALLISLLASAVAGTVGYIAAGHYFGSAAFRNFALGGEVRAALPWLTLVIPAAMVASVLGGALQGRFEFLKLNVINTSGSVLMALLPLIAAYALGPSLALLIGAGLVAKLIECTLLFVACSNTIPLTRPRAPKWRVVKELFALGSWITISAMLGPILENSDRFVIGAFIGAEAVAAYVITYNLVTRLTLIPSSLARALYPRFASTTADGGQLLEVTATRAVVAVMTPIAFLTLVALEPFLRLWLGTGIATIAHPVGSILVVGVWLNSVAQVPYVSLQGRARADLPAKLHIAYLVPYFAVLYFAVSRFGLIGAALAWSFRSFWDPALFLMTGNMGRVLPFILPSVLVVAATAAITIGLDSRTAEYWLSLAVLGGIAIFLSARVSPVPLSGAIPFIRQNLKLDPISLRR